MKILANYHCTWAFIAVWLLGCGAGSHKITGTVTYDGELVATGEISLVPIGLDGPPDAGKIEGGRYTVVTSPGEKRVEIRASRPLPEHRQNSPEMGLLYEDYIPASYNSDSTLTLNVVPGGSREFDFQLTPP
jgi:hypothetical protein